ncbi:MAG TPA: hypothetical protein VH877_25210 [Polyangia bacterium]|nr:hypothetical protein [Polyangia bacterium]
MLRHVTLAVVAILAGGMLGPARVWASTAEVFGLGSTESALAGASAARVRDFSAVHYDPAGLTRLEGPQATVGVLGFGSRLTIDDRNGRRAAGRLVDPAGVVIGAGAPIPFRGVLEGRLFIAIALFVPRDIVRVIARGPEEAFFPYYDNRTQRLIVVPALAARLGRGLSLGIAANFLAGLNGRILASEGAIRAIEARVDEQTISTVAMNVGLRWQSPQDRVAAALVYRQAFSVPFTTQAQTVVAGQRLDINIAAAGLYTPHTLVVGGALRLRPWLLLSADVTVAFWSAWDGPYVRVSAVLPILGPLSPSPPRLRFHDVVSPRVGVEIDRPLSPRWQLAVRAGAGFESSAIPARQTGITNLLDGEKGIFAAGLGTRVKAGSVGVRVDLHGQVQVVRSRTLVKRLADPGTQPDPVDAVRDEVPDDPSRPETLGPQVSNPGWPRISGGGAVWSAGLAITVER